MGAVAAGLLHMLKILKPFITNLDGLIHKITKTTFDLQFNKWSIVLATKRNFALVVTGCTVAMDAKVVMSGVLVMHFVTNKIAIRNTKMQWLELLLMMVHQKDIQIVSKLILEFQFQISPCTI